MQFQFNPLSVKKSRGQTFCLQIFKNVKSKLYHTVQILMYWDRQASANSADQDQTASEEAV